MDALLVANAIGYNLLCLPIFNPNVLGWFRIHLDLQLEPQIIFRILYPGFSFELCLFDRDFESSPIGLRTVFEILHWIGGYGVKGSDSTRYIYWNALVWNGIDALRYVWLRYMQVAARVRLVLTEETSLS